VVETDLGEYIVQLRGEKPAHINHARRAFGAATRWDNSFTKNSASPTPMEIPILTDTARKVLREVFLTADVGISGVNFGVAETGTLCIVTNEGNGRMLPPCRPCILR